MIKRINLIGKEPFQVTYRTIFIGVGLSLFICFLFYGGLFFSNKKAVKDTRQLIGEIERLKNLRAQLMSQEEIAQLAGPLGTIQVALRKAPPWVLVLQTISTSLPSNVWLTSMKTFDKEGSKKTILLNGQAKNPQGLAHFLAALEKSPFFDHVGLTTSKEEQGVFNFTASCDLIAKR